MKHPKKLLATGHSGFVGTALQNWLAEHPSDGVQWCNVTQEHDLLDPASLRRMVEAHKPDWILHLAAQSHVPASWEDPARTLQVNIGGTANLLRVLGDSGFQGRLLYVSSADVYGTVEPGALPVTEEAPAAPRNPYAASKAGAELLCQAWARTQGVDIVIARPFNHTGAGQRPDFALPGFAKSIAAIRLGMQPARILTGDLGVTRDFLDVRDVVPAYLALLAGGRTGEIYNVCSQREYNLRATLDELIAIGGIQAEVAEDPALMRPSEQRRMCGSHAKITAATGWLPRIPLRDTLAQLIDYWTKELKQ